MMNVWKFAGVAGCLLCSLFSFSQTADSLSLPEPPVLPADSVSAQPDVPVVQADTIKPADLKQSVDSEQALEAMLLRMLREQGQELARQQAARDSIIQWRMKNDTTTLVPLHLGYLDSVRISERLAFQKGAHPLTIELVLRPLELQFTSAVSPPDFGKLYFGTPRTVFPVAGQAKPATPDLFADERIVNELRTEALRQITISMMGVYKSTFDQLPDAEQLHARNLTHGKAALPEQMLSQRRRPVDEQHLRVKPIQLRKWVATGSALLQVTQNYISPNWYTGGNSNLAILGILTGSLKYDNRKNITWENTGEWRAGFNSVAGDTIHKLSTNEDVLQLYSKLNIKAFDKFSYSMSAEVKTQLFDTYDGMNSTTLKTAFFSPFRFNLAVGLDYKPNSDLSIVVSPLAYKYVFVRDTVRIDQTAYSVEGNRRFLSELGSSLRIAYTWRPVDGISLEGKYYFYTNYKRIETELELVANFVVNRFLSTRVSLHPRYDSTVILADGQKARLQFKEFISFGFSHYFK